MLVELYPHQQKALEELSNGKILWGGVGTGKSAVAAAYYMAKELPRDVYVITTAKKRDSLDWEAEFVAYGIYKSAETTVGGILTVDSWNNIEKYLGVKDAFFIFDEQRVVGSGAWASAFLRIAASNRWIVLSATPGDTWIDYIPVFIANGFYKNRTAFKQEHVVYSYHAKFPKVERYLGVGKLIRHRDSILVEMPFVRRTVRHTTLVECDYDKELMEKCQIKRWNVFEQRPLKDVAELFRVSRKIANTHESRLKQVKTLLDRHPRVIVFYNFDYELELLRNLLVEHNSKSSLDQSTTTNGISSTNISIAEWNGHKHEPIPDTANWVYLVQYTAGSEGWNCTLTNAMCFYSLTYSYKAWHQAFGRIDRLNTPWDDLYYYVLKSSSWIDNAIWKSLQTKKSFNERDMKVKW